MAAEIRSYTAVIPAGTPKSAPVTIDMSFPARVVDTIEIRVPPGPSGVVGFAIQNSGLTVIPYDSDDYIVTAAEAITWGLDGYITSGSWQLIGYNTGANDHAIYVRFLLSLPSQPAQQTATAMIDDDILNNAALSGQADEGVSG